MLDQAPSRVLTFSPDPTSLPEPEDAQVPYLCFACSLHCHMAGSMKNPHTEISLPEKTLKSDFKTRLQRKPRSQLMVGGWEKGKLCYSSVGNPCFSLHLISSFSSLKTSRTPLPQAETWPPYSHPRMLTHPTLDGSPSPED